ncbi:MAG: hypothetical protein ACE5HB_05915, partial [Terriglobia bacterium]
MYAHRLRAVSVVLAGVDVAVAVGSFIAAYLFRHALLPALAGVFPFLPPLGLFPFRRYLPVLAAIVAIWLLSGYLLGVYRPRELRERRQAVLDPSKQVFLGALALAAFLFFSQGVYVSRTLLVTFWLLDWFLQVAARLAYIEWGPRLRERWGDAYHILVVGTSERARGLAAIVRDRAQMGLRL